MRTKSKRDIRRAVALALPTVLVFLSSCFDSNDGLIPSSGNSASALSANAGPNTKFQLTEYFGASWPDQPIEFRYDGTQPDQNHTRMVGPAGTEVPYQWVSSCSDAS